MKKLNPAFIVAVFLAFSVCAAAVSVKAAVKVRAEDFGFMRVITEDAPFFTEKTASAPAFYLPYTYYVRVIERGEIFTHVEYGSGGAAIDGFVPTEKLFADGLTVENRYPTPDVYTAATAVLYKNSALTESVQYVFEGRKLYLYGAYVADNGEKLYYVGYNNKLGYVKEESLVPFTLPYHPNELTFLATDDDEEEDNEPAPKSAENDAVLRISVIAVLGAAGLFALVAAVSKKTKPAPAASYYDENDYE